MKRRIFILNLVLIMLFSSCSSLIEDLSKMSSGTKYVVKHYIQKLEADDEEFYEDDYEEESSESLFGKDGELTEAKAKNLKGFSLAKEINQVVVTPDGQTVVNVYYKRNSYTITLNPDNGVWNYDDWKNGETPKNEKIVLTGKYDAETKIGNIDFDSLKKKSNELSGWTNDLDGEYIKFTTEKMIENLSKYPAFDVTYTACWTSLGNIPYKIEYYIPSLGDETVYELYNSNEEKGVEDEETEVVGIEIPGFTVKNNEIEQQIIKADGSTVVKVYYTRNKYTVTLNLGDDDAYWYYAEAGQSQEPKVYNQLFGSSLDYSIIETAGKKGGKLKGWKKDGEIDIIPTESLPSNITAEDLSFTAVWEDKIAPYTVKHLFESVDGEYIVDSEKTQTLEGKVEFDTEAKPLDILGYIPQDITQVAIAEEGTAVEIKYDRKEYTIVFSLEGGSWNYTSSRTTPENLKKENKTFSGKWGTAVTLPDFSEIGKKYSEFKCWYVDDESENLPKESPVSEFPIGDKTFRAAWNSSASCSYVVNHMLEQLDSSYKLNESEKLPGEKEDYTDAAAKTVGIYEAFIPQEFSQVEVASDNSTVVEIKYTRKSYSVTLKLGEDAFWNYGAASKSGEPLVITDKYEAPVSYSLINTAGKKGYKLSGWIKTGEIAVIQTEELPSTIQKGDVEYTADWEENIVPYKVKHSFETLDGSYVIDETLTEDKEGQAEFDSKAVAKTRKGFEAQTVVQAPLAKDGSTVVIVKYDRVLSNFVFKANGGQWSDGTAADKKVAGKYESQFDSKNAPVPVKAGWKFGGWNSFGGVAEGEYGLEDTVFVAYWAAAVTPDVNLPADIGLKFEKTTTNTVSVILPSGYDGETWTYEWYVDSVKIAPTERILKISDSELGRGIHRITVKAVCNGMSFTKAGSITVE